MNNPAIGSVVCAKAGKDAGRYFVILRSENEYVYISDGKRRKVQNPKKKKLKHIIPTYYSDECICQRISSGDEITNKEIRRALTNYLKRNDNN